jgi:hypothetical protein
MKNSIKQLGNTLMHSQIAERIRDTYERVLTFFRGNIWYPFLHRTVRRYHVLDLRDGGNGYGIGWYDTDTRMLQANFLLLKEFVEGEEPFKIIDWEWSEESSAAGKEIKTLYHWWTVERGEKHAALDREWATVGSPELIPREGGGIRFQLDPKSKELLEKRDLLDLEDDEMLLRLIKIRHFLWT